MPEKQNDLGSKEQLARIHELPPYAYTGSKTGVTTYYSRDGSAFVHGTSPTNRDSKPLAYTSREWIAFMLAVMNKDFDRTAVSKPTRLFDENDDSKTRTTKSFVGAIIETTDRLNDRIDLLADQLKSDPKIAATVEQFSDRLPASPEKWRSVYNAMWRRVRGDAHDVFRAPSESLFGTVAPNNFLPDVELGMAIATKRAINAGHRSPHLGHIPMQGWESWEVQVLPVDNVDELLKIALGRAFPDHLPPARPLEISSQILLTKGRVPVLGAIGHMSEIYSHLTLGGIQTISPNGTDLWFDADGLSSESRDPSVRDRAMFAQLATQRLDQPDVSTALLG